MNDDLGIFDELDIDKDLENKLHDTSKLKRKITVSTSNRARPKKMANFAPYERMFKKIQADLASGRRKLVRFKNYEIEEDRFYVLRGQLIYIDAIGDTFDANNNDRYKKKMLECILSMKMELKVCLYVMVWQLHCMVVVRKVMLKA